MKTIIVTASDQAWQDAQATGEYTQSTITSTLKDVDFIHATFPDQTIDMVNRHFTNRDDVILLFVDANEVKAPIKYEKALSGRPGTFPHIYGPLSVDAVYDTVKLEKDNKSKFIAPNNLKETA